jgi:hypothetical protein
MFTTEEKINNIIKTDRLTHGVMNRVKSMSEKYPGYKPTHWGYLSWYESSPCGGELEHACATMREYFIKVARKVNAHVIPIVGIGQTQKGKWHAHYTLLVETKYGTDTPKRRPVRREMEKLWYRGTKRGRDRAWLYKSELGGTVYSLRHEYYMVVDAPFCPGNKKCKAGCVKLQGYKDIISKVLEPNGEGSRWLAADSTYNANGVLYKEAVEKAEKAMLKCVKIQQEEET